MQYANTYTASNYNIAVSKAVAIELHENGTTISRNAFSIVKSERNLVSDIELIWDVNCNAIYLVNKGKGKELDQDTLSALILLPNDVRLEFISTL